MQPRLIPADEDIIGIYRRQTVNRNTRPVLDRASADAPVGEPLQQHLADHRAGVEYKNLAEPLQAFRGGAVTRTRAARRQSQLHREDRPGAVRAGYRKASAH